MVGGLWVSRTRTGSRAATRRCEMNTSGPRMSYSDFPSATTDYPLHEDVGEYFDRYVDHFGIRETITFNTRVERGRAGATTAASRSRSRTSRRRRGDARVRRGPGRQRPPLGSALARAAVSRVDFDGIEMHAHDYRDARAARRQAGGRRRRRQQRHGHRPRRRRRGEAAFLSLRRGVPRDPQAARAQAQADRPDAGCRRGFRGRSSRRGSRCCAMRSGDIAELRVPRARPQGRPRPPDGLRRDPRPARRRAR